MSIIACSDTTLGLMPLLTSSDTGDIEGEKERERGGREGRGEREREREREERERESERRRDITLRDTKTLSNGLVSQDITFYARATQSLKWRENESMGRPVCGAVGGGRFVYVL